MSPRFRPLLIGLRVASGIAYPFIVYFGIGVVPSAALVALGLVLVAFNLAAARLIALSRTGIVTLLAGAALIGALALLSPLLAVRAYPVINSLAAAAIFAVSLANPPNLVERIARLSEPDLPPEAMAYTRRVAIAWVVLLVANALISLSTALWGTLAQWTLWNGLLSYLAMGTMFVGEFLLRQVVRRRRRLARS